MQEERVKLKKELLGKKYIGFEDLEMSQPILNCKKIMRKCVLAKTSRALAGQLFAKE